MTDDSLERLRRPEHTGENRCWPCTVVNVVLVGLGTLLLARRRRTLALGAAAVGGAAVWLRGYVVPGTPRFAPRLVAALPLPYDPFDHGEYAPDPSASGVAETEVGVDGTTGSADVSGPDAGEESTAADGTTAPAEPGSLGEEVLGEELVERLLAADVLESDGEALVVEAAFDEAWRAAMADLAEMDTGSLAEATFEAAHAATVDTFENEDGEWVVLGDGSGQFDGETWLTRPVAVAEAGAVRALADWVDEATARAAAGPLRMFLHECPDCGTELVESTTAACCGGMTDPRSEPDEVLACPECRARLYTFAA
jgi:hypothetical protein